LTNKKTVEEGRRNRYSFFLGKEKDRKEKELRYINKRERKYQKEKAGVVWAWSLAVKQERSDEMRTRSIE